MLIINSLRTHLIIRISSILIRRILNYGNNNKCNFSNSNNIKISNFSVNNQTPPNHIIPSSNNYRINYYHKLNNLKTVLIINNTNK